VGEEKSIQRNLKERDSLEDISADVMVIPTHVLEK